MNAKQIYVLILKLCFSLLLTPLCFSEEVSQTGPFQQKATEINDYTELIKQINEEKKNTIGYEAGALSKQLTIHEESNRNLLWQFVDDLVASGRLINYRTVFALPANINVIKGTACENL